MKKIVHKLFLLAGLFAALATTALFAQNSDTYYFEDFESLSVLGPNKPDGWETGSGENSWGGFSAAIGNGIDGGNAFKASVSNADERWLYTQALNMGASPMVEFYYTASGILGGAADANAFRVEISVSTDDATTWTKVADIASSEFDGVTTDFTKFHTDLPADYANQSCRIKVGVFMVDAGGNFLIDNLSMGTDPNAAPAGEEPWIEEDFEELSVLGPNKPAGWETGSGNNPWGGFSAAVGKGIDGGNAFSANVGSADERWFYTQDTNLGSAPQVEFYYTGSGILGGAADANAFRVLISVSTDNAATWTVVDSIAPSAFDGTTTDFTFKKTVLPAAYANQKCRIRIGAWQAESNGNFLVDNFAMGTKAQQPASLVDLAVKGALQGSANPALNEEAAYEVTVINNGTDDAENYCVKLMMKGETEDVMLDSVPGTQIEPAATANFTLKWTPATAGQYTLYAEVIMAGDEKQDNNRTADFTAEVLASGTAWQLGNGTILTNEPVSFTQPKNIFQILYLAEELKYTAADIRSIILDGNFSKNLTSKVKIWIGETEKKTFDVNEEHFEPIWFDPTGFTLAFNADVNFPQGDHQKITFTLDQPYRYSGAKTLILYFYNENETMEEDYQVGRFYATSTMGGTTVVVGNNGDNIDPMQPSGCCFKFQRPNTTFIVEEIEGEKYDLGFRIKDQNGNAVTGAVITLNGNAVETEYANGIYTVKQLPARGYQYRITKTGYVSIDGTTPFFNDTVVDITMWNLQGIVGISDYINEDFETVEAKKRPFKWLREFAVEAENGVNNSHCLTHSFWVFDGMRDLETAPVFMGSEPIFEFQYRVMGLNPETGTRTEEPFAGNNLTWKIEVSTNLGQTWEEIYNEDYGVHTSSIEFKTFTADVSKYANEVCIFLLTVNRDYLENDAFWFDIDNWKIGTQRENDLLVVNPVKGTRMVGAGQTDSIRVAVRNAGKNSVSGYTVKLFNGENEVGSLTANETLASGASSVHTFAYTPAEEGDFTLTAKVVPGENDEVEFNNTSANFYLNVMEEGSRGVDMPTYDGEDRYYQSPISFYSPVSASQVLYPANELDVKTGECITGMALRTNFSKALSKRRITVYAGETISDHLIGGATGMNPYSLPVNQMQKVFEGELDFSDVDGANLVIPFDVPYKYTGKNLVICSYKQEAEASATWDEDMTFYGLFTLSKIRHIYVTLDEAADINHIDFSNATNAFNYPATTFLTRSDVEMHKVTFNVVDQDGNAVKGATVTFNGVAKPAGVYTIDNVADGEYFYTVTLGEIEENGEVTVDGEDVTETVVLKGVANEKNHAVMTRTYPNPCLGKLFVETSAEAKEIGVYNIQGREVVKFNHVHAGTLEIDLSREKAGIYLLMIDGQAHKITKR